jgi:anti-anti-sigma factor
MAGTSEHFSATTQRVERSGDEGAARGGSVTIVALHGELDMAGTFLLEPRLDDLVAARPPPDAVVFDLRGLTFVDSTGLAILVDGHRRLEEAGVDTRFLRGSDDVQRVFTVAGFDGILPFEEVAPE